jgi:hypothetical protein
MAIKPENACYGKRGHDGRRGARDQLKRMVKARVPDPRTGNPVKKEDFNTYHCPFCDLWHVGHKDIQTLRANASRRGEGLILPAPVTGVG